jgi:hypothetical protein
MRRTTTSTSRCSGVRSVSSSPSTSPIRPSDVRAPVDLGRAVELLRRHEGRGPDELAGAREAGAADIAAEHVDAGRAAPAGPDPGEPEVRDPGAGGA